MTTLIYFIVDDKAESSVILLRIDHVDQVILINHLFNYYKSI